MSVATTQDPRQLFQERYVPEIEMRSRLHFRRLDREAQEEAVQETMCQSWAMFVSAMANGKRCHGTPGAGLSKKGSVTPASLALFANKRVDAGWRFAGSSTTDVLADRTRRVGRVEITSLDGGEGRTLSEVLADRRAENDPAGLAAARIDWSTFRTSGLLTAKAQKALDLAALGYRNGQLAQALGVCDARATQIRQQIGESLRQFFGSDLPAPVQKTPKRKGGRHKRRGSRSGRGRRIGRRSA